MSDRENSPAVEENGENADHSPAPRERTRSRSASSHRRRSRSRSNHRRSKSRSRSRRRSSHRKEPHRSHKRRSRSRSYSRSPKRHHRRHSKSRSRSRSRSRSHDRSRKRYSRSRSRSPRYGGRGGRYLGARDCPAPSSCVGIFGMNINSTESTLAHYFSPYGKIEKIQIVYDAKTGRSRGFGFVYFENIEDAIAAKDRAAGMEIEGHRIRVDFSVTQRPHTPTPGIYMGKPMYRGRRDDYYPPRYGYNRSPSPYRSRKSRSYSYSPRRD